MLFTTQHKGKDFGPRHIWTHEVEQRSPETSHRICPHLTDTHVCFHEIRRCADTHDCIGVAFGTLHRQIKCSAGCSPGPINQLCASWISFNYITYMEMRYTLHRRMSSNTLSLPQNKEAEHKRNYKCYFWQWDTN